MRLKRALCLLSLLACAACINMPSYCLKPGDIGNFEIYQFTVPANAPYFNTNVAVDAGDEFSLHIQGSMNLCPGELALSPKNPSFPISPQKETWQETPFKARKDNPFALRAAGAYFDRSGRRELGKGLYVLIIDEKEFEAQKSQLNDLDFDADPEPNNDHKAFGGKQNYEMFSFDKISGGKEVVSLSMPFDGRIYFRYARSADAKKVVKSGGDLRPESPWRGYYAWTDRCDPCVKMGPLAAITEVCRDYAPDSPNCREPTGDHWVDDDYKKNSGGYDVTFYSGCYVENGANIDVAFGGLGESVPNTRYKGTNVPCISQSNGLCENSGTFSPNGAPSGTPYAPGKDFLGVKVNLAGAMEKMAKAPGKGNVIFKLNDQYQKPSDLVSPSGACAGAGKDVSPACCFLNAWPEDSIGEKFNDASCPSPIQKSGAQLCAKYSNSCIPAAGYTGYADNVGSYTVVLNVQRKPKINRFLRAVSRPVERLLYGACSGNDSAKSEAECGNTDWTKGIAERVYTAAVESKGYRLIVYALATLMVTLYGYAHMLGLVKDTARETIVRVIYVGIVFTLLAPESWQILYKYLFSFFIEGIDGFMIILQSDILFSFFDDVDTSANEIQNIAEPTASGFPGISIEDPFDFFYYTFYWIFNGMTILKMLSFLMYEFPFGIFYLFLFLIILILYLVLILRTFFMVLVAKVTMAILISVAPMFFIMLFFNKMRPLFYNWLKILASFMMQAVVMVTAVAMFNILFFVFMYKLLSIPLCVGCVINLEIFPFWHWFDFCLFYFFKPHPNYVKPLLFFVIILTLHVGQHVSLSLTKWTAIMFEAGSATLKEVAEKMSADAQRAITAPILGGMRMAMKGASMASKLGKGGGTTNR